MSTFKPNSLNCGYRVILILSEFNMPSDIYKYILNTLHNMLRSSVLNTFNQQITNKVYNQSRVDKTLHDIFRFIVSNEESFWICRTFDSYTPISRDDPRKISLNIFQRKIVYALCSEPDFGVSFEKLDLEQHRGGSWSKCNCGATGKGNYVEDWHSYSSDSDSDDVYSGPCKKCEES